MLTTYFINVYKYFIHLYTAQFITFYKCITITSVFTVFVLQTPGHFIGQFNQFALERVFSDILGDTTYVAWTDDSKYVN